MLSNKRKHQEEGIVNIMVQSCSYFCADNWVVHKQALNRECVKILNSLSVQPRLEKCHRLWHWICLTLDSHLLNSALDIWPLYLTHLSAVALNWYAQTPIYDKSMNRHVRTIFGGDWIGCAQIGYNMYLNPFCDEILGEGGNIFCWNFKMLVCVLWKVNNVTKQPDCVHNREHLIKRTQLGFHLI